MSKLVLLFVCVAVFQLANALQCYQCDKEACEKSMDQWQKSNCAKAALPSQDSACLKFVYKDTATKKDTTSRKCVIVDKDQKYKCNPNNNDQANVGEEVFCETCQSDLCNSASKISFSVMAVAGIFLALLIPKFLA